MHKNVELKIKKIFYKFLVAIFGITAPDYPNPGSLSKFGGVFIFRKKFSQKILQNFKNQVKFTEDIV